MSDELIDYRVKDTKCKQCGYDFSGALGGDEQPKVGDVSICIKCQHVGIFEENFSVREPTEQELLIMPWGEISKMQRMLKTIVEARDANAEV